MNSDGPNWRLIPYRNRTFWAIQALVVGIAVAHTGLETLGKIEFPQALYLVPSSLFFLPVVFAALTFGVRGALPTSLWCVALTIPNLVFLHHGMDRLGVVWQGLILLCVGVFVGVTVDHERTARREAESREMARRASEGRYRALYDNAAEAVLIVGEQGTIEDANRAAVRLLGPEVGEMRGRLLDSIVGPELAADVLSSAQLAQPRLLPQQSGPPIWVQLIGCAPLADGVGLRRTQVMLHDVTREYEGRQELEGYARHADAAREEERRRIGRELHDGPLQSLMLLSRQLQSIDAEPQSSEIIEDAHEIIEETAGELRRISRALRPPILDDLGLEAALRAEVAAFSRRTGMGARFDLAGGPTELAPDVELMLLRVVQEGLHNIERHSGATSAELALTFDDDGVSLEVRDDGRGMGKVPAATELLAMGKLGLIGMRERARLAHGVLTVGDRPGGGTSIAVEVPAAGVTRGG